MGKADKVMLHPMRVPYHANNQNEGLLSAKPVQKASQPFEVQFKSADTDNDQIRYCPAASV